MAKRKGKAEAQTTVEAPSLIVAGVNFTELGFPRRFTGGEMERFIDLKAEHGFHEATKPFEDDALNEVLSRSDKAVDAFARRLKKEAQKPYAEWDRKALDKLEVQLERLGQKRLATRTALFEAVSDQLAKELDKDEPDDALMEALIDGVNVERERWQEAARGDLEPVLTLNEERQLHNERLLRVLEAVYVDMTYHLASEADATTLSLEEWREAVGEDDEQHDAAAEIVESGTFLAASNRQQRRRRSKRDSNAGSGRRTLQA